MSRDGSAAACTERAKRIAGRLWQIELIAAVDHDYETAFEAVKDAIFKLRREVESGRV